MALLGGPAVADAIGDPNSALAKLAVAQPDDGKLVDEIFLRVLNRPATEREITSTLGAWNQLESEHTALLAAAQVKETEQAAIIAKAETDRIAAIDAAKAEHEDIDELDMEF